MSVKIVMNGLLNLLGLLFCMHLGGWFVFMPLDVTKYHESMHQQVNSLVSFLVTISYRFY